MIIFIYGADNYRSERRLKVLMKAFAEKYDVLNCIVLAGHDITSVDKLVSKVASDSLFGTRRMIVVKGLLSENKDKELLEAVAREIESGIFDKQDGNVVIFYEGTSKLKAGKLLAALKKQKAERFEPLAGTQLNRFIREQTKLFGGTIEPDAVDSLATNASIIGGDSPDLFMLENELKKLIAYKDGGTITAYDVDELCVHAVAGRIFALTDYLGQRHGEKALEELNKLRLSGHEETFIFAMVGKHIRNLIMVSDLNGRGMNVSEIAKTTKLHPFVIKKALVQGRQFHFAELAQLYKQLFLVDKKTKRGELMDPTLALDKLVLGLAISKQKAEVAA